jgi:putative colanic acid biosynthesis glycosyltransferase WcaI
VSRILLLSLNYAPEPTGFAPHTTALAEHLHAVGHEVTVLTGFPFAPRWARYPEYRGEFRRCETANGVRMVRLTHFIPRSPGRVLDRLLMEGSFAVSGAAFLLPWLVAGLRYDLVMYVGAQPAIAWLGRIVAALSRASFVVKITDLAAQAGRDVGIVRSPWLAGILERVEFAAYRPARAAVVLCEAFRESLADHGFPRTAVHVIRDSIDLDALHPVDSGHRFRERHGIPRDAFVILYSGSLGLKQGLFDVVEAARSMSAAPHVRWVLVGEGETRRALEERIAAADLGDRIVLLPLQPESEMNEMFAAADVLLLSQLKSVKDTVIPSKLLTYMAAGRPILAAVNTASQAAAIVRDARCGILVEPESPAALITGVAELMSKPHERVAMAGRSRAYAEQHFDRSAIVVAQQRVIEQLVKPRYPRMDVRLGTAE